MSNSIYIYKISRYIENVENLKKKLIAVTSTTRVQIDIDKGYLFVTASVNPEMEVQLACRILGIEYEGFIGKKDLPPEQKDLVVVPPDNILFGQYLIETKIVKKEIIEKALRKQDEEKNSTMKSSHRLLGQILMDDFGIFNSRLELNNHLKRYAHYKAKMEEIYFEAKILVQKMKHKGIGD